MKEKLKVRDGYAIGLMQARKYWGFLFFTPDDICQEICLALFTHPPKENLKAFSLALNRGLYKLARSQGFRKRHMNEGINEKGQWWERKEFGMDEVKIDHFGGRR